MPHRILPFALTLFCLSAVASLPAAEQTKDTLKTVQEKVDSGDAVLVDVREQEEWDAGHVEGAIFLPLSALKDGLSKEELESRLPEGKVLYTYCRSGRRSVAAAEILEKTYSDVRALKPGYAELIEFGFRKAEE